MDPHGYTPVIEIDVDGKPVAGAFYSLLVEAVLTDNEGETVDTLSITLDDRDNLIELPRKGAEISVRLGYREIGLVDKGLFKVETVAIEGGVERGEQLIITANAADLRKEVKGEGRKAYEDKTFGEIIKAEAAKMGLQATVDPELAQIKFPWKMRWDQSRIDFVTRLANEVGGVAKPAGGKLIVQKRGGGRSASGGELAPVVISRSDCSEWSAEPDGRMQYGSIEARWTDPKTGKEKTEKRKTGGGGPASTLRDAFHDQAAAKKAIEAEAGRLNRETGEVSFTLYGRPQAQAGAPVRAIGFRTGVPAESRASTVVHTVKAGPHGGYTTEIQCKKKEEQEEDD